MLLSAFAIYVYSGIDVKVIPLTALLYAVGLSYYWFWPHPRIKRPSGRAFRPASAEHERKITVTKTIDTARTESDAGDAPRRPSPLLEWLAAAVLLLVAVALAWMTLVADRPDWLRSRLRQNRGARAAGIADGRPAAGQRGRPAEHPRVIPISKSASRTAAHSVPVAPQRCDSRSSSPAGATYQPATEPA